LHVVPANWRHLDKLHLLVGVNYPDRSASIILAGSGVVIDA